MPLTQRLHEDAGSRPCYSTARWQRLLCARSSLLLAETQVTQRLVGELSDSTFVPRSNVFGDIFPTQKPRTELSLRPWFGIRARHAVVVLCSVKIHSVQGKPEEAWWLDEPEHVPGARVKPPQLNGCWPRDSRRALPLSVDFGRGAFHHNPTIETTDGGS